MIVPIPETIVPVSVSVTVSWKSAEASFPAVMLTDVPVLDPVIFPAPGSNEVRAHE